MKVLCSAVLVAMPSTFLYGCGSGDKPAGPDDGSDKTTKPATIATTTTTTTTTTTVNLRGQALCDGEVMELYHQTDMVACKSILDGGFDLGRTTPGNQGMGTYFADTAQATGHKTRHMGCVIKALVRVGNIFDMENAWLPDMENNETLEGLGIPDEAGCDTMLGYKLMEKNFHSITTVKHGRERAIFFDDQILDMVAYPTDTNWGNNADVRGPYLNDRSELKKPEGCNPADYPVIEPPPCKFDGKVQRETCLGFTNAGCFTIPNGNVDAMGPCSSGTVLKSAELEWNECNKGCFDNNECQGFQFSGENSCTMYSDVPKATHQEKSNIWCMKRSVPGGKLVAV